MLHQTKIDAADIVPSELILLMQNLFGKEESLAFDIIHSNFDVILQILYGIYIYL